MSKMMMILLVMLIIIVFVFLFIVILWSLLKYFTMTYEKYKSMSTDFIKLCNEIMHDAMMLAITIIIMTFVVGFIAILIDYFLFKK